MKLIVIIPAYNEANTITGVIRQIPKAIEGVDQIVVLVVDDGSTDNTVARVKSEMDALVVSHNSNRGVGEAFHTGIDYALENRADLVVNIDADGQFNPLDIPKLIKPILDNQADFVSASRFIEKDYIPRMPWIKFWGNQQIAGMISWLTKRKLHDVSCGFRAYNKEALLNLNLFGRFTYTQETFLDLSFKNLRIKEVPVRVQYFDDRQSKVCRNIFSYTRNIVSIILMTVRDYRPLKFFGSIGVFILILGLALGLFIFRFYLKTGTFSPYKSVGVLGILLCLVGMIVLVLGFIADMLYRIRMNQEKLLYYKKKKHFYS